MTDALVEQIYRDQQAILQQRKRFPRVLIVFALLLISAGSIYVGLNSDNLVQVASAARSVAAPAANIVEETVKRVDFESFQRRTADSMQSAAQDIAAQKAELKNLSDQVAALAAKIDALQSEVRPIPPYAAPQPPVPAVTASHKRSATVKPTGPISVGGAPLPLAQVH